MTRRPLFVVREQRVLALAALALATACATTRTQHAAADEHATVRSEARVTETHDAAPSTIIVEEYAEPPAAPGGTAAPVLVRRTTTTTGQVHDARYSDLLGSGELVAHATDDTSRTATPELPKVPVGCALAGSLWLYVVAAVALGGGVPLLAWARRAIAAFRGRSP